MAEQGADDELVEVIDAGGQRVSMTRRDAWQAGLQPIEAEPETDTEGTPAAAAAREPAEPDAASDAQAEAGSDAQPASGSEPE